MSSKDPYAHLPNLAGSAGHIEEIRTSGDPDRFFPPIRAGDTSSVTGRILNVPRVRVVRAGALSIPLSTVTAIAFDTKIYDEAGAWPGLINATPLIAKTSGLYATLGVVYFDTVVAGAVRASWIQKNNVTTFRYGTDYKPVNTVPSICKSFDYIEMEAGEYLQLFCFQDGASPLALTSEGSLHSFAEFGFCLASSFGSDN